jgi:hypothetical protein
MIDFIPLEIILGIPFVTAIAGARHGFRRGLGRTPKNSRQPLILPRHQASSLYFRTAAPASCPAERKRMLRFFFGFARLFPACSNLPQLSSFSRRRDREPSDPALVQAQSGSPFRETIIVTKPGENTDEITKNDPGSARRPLLLQPQ